MEEDPFLTNYSYSASQIPNLLTELKGLLPC